METVMQVDNFYDSFVARVRPEHLPKLAASWRDVANDGREYALSLPMRTHDRKRAMLDARRWRLRAFRLERELANGTLNQEKK
jgi:hypothetical protein